MRNHCIALLISVYHMLGFIKSTCTLLCHFLNIFLNIRKGIPCGIPFLLNSYSLILSVFPIRTIPMVSVLQIRFSLFSYGYLLRNSFAKTSIPFISSKLNGNLYLLARLAFIFTSYSIFLTHNKLVINDNIGTGTLWRFLLKCHCQLVMCHCICRSIISRMPDSSSIIISAVPFSWILYGPDIRYLD